MTGPHLLRRQSTDRPRGDEGMTVLELTVAAALLLLILAPVFVFLAAAQRNENSNQNATGQQASARLALQEMTRFLREANYPQGSTYATTNSDLFKNASGYEVTFFSNVGAVLNSGVIDEVDYSISGTNLVQTLIPPDSTTCTSSCTYTGTGTTRTVVSNLANESFTNCTNINAAVPMFTYYDQDASTGALTLQGNSGDEDSNYVVITAVTGPPTGQTGACTQVQTAVSLRNWRP